MGSVDPAIVEAVKEVLRLNGSTVEEAVICISDPQFHNKTRIHDWRNYVPREFQSVWHKLSATEQILLFSMAEIQASNEEWE